MQQGRAEGGEGIDTYHILQHQDSEHRSIELTETIGMGEYSNILLDYRAEQIISISRRNTDVFLLLRNDRTDSNSHPLMTHLKLRNLYGPRQNNNKRVLQHNYRLETRDRSPLSGWLENIIDDNDHDLSKLIDTMSHFSSHAENNSRLEDVSSSYRSNPTFFTTEGKYAK
ncbi:hypothetical protein CCS41_14080 (plasmid) [Candidatus Fukatsuia symbiotica]|uniref:Uncharacterized protein n=1 Tax=Candidatus Fukatsuia symbiotica TaxID=1878942 RepID=A0A2U8I8Z1_9GAMM|nr:hypothetical protein [Candidatus Fukatsuia symbiotica]AWK15548.1 hypothetical protein CCS41_14080 [Candidatus Fukatsuia symbiotica]